MHTKRSEVLSRGMKVVLLVLILISLFIIYYEKVVRQNFTVLTLPEGPDTSDYFVE